jgi:hypothetical protein
MNFDFNPHNLHDNVEVPLYNPQRWAHFQEIHRDGTQSLAPVFGAADPELGHIFALDRETHFNTMENLVERLSHDLDNIKARLALLEEFVLHR